MIQLLLPLFFFAGLTGLAFFPEIQTEFRLESEPDTSKPLKLIITMNIPDELHVYTAADMFFGIKDVQVQNLGPAAITLPPTKTVPDFLSDEPNARTQVFYGKAVFTIERPATAAAGRAWIYKGEITYQACTDTICLPPASVPFSFSGTIGAPGSPVTSAQTTTQVDINGGTWQTRGLWLGILASFFAGILLSLTPCVYPMVGITIAVIGGRNAGRRQRLWLTFLYVLGLSIAYALLGLLVARVGAPAAAFLRSAWVLIPVAVVFILLGLSMFDLFTLQTPPALAAKLQNLGAGRGAPGIFLMGAMSAIVVGPCVTGPLLGLITFVATTGRMLTGFAYFFALAWGMGLILFVAGAASGLLPKAGGWMEDIKHVLGVVLIWGAFYFLRPLTSEPVFLAATLTAVAAGIGVIGWLKVPELGSGFKPWLRFSAGILIIFSSVYLQQKQLDVPGTGTYTAGKVELQRELAGGRPVLLDFTAPWCVICKQIERTTLSKPEVQLALQKYNFVKVDYDTNPELVRRFNIIGPPAFIFLDAAGNQDGATIVTGDKLEQRLLR